MGSCASLPHSGSSVAPLPSVLPGKQAFDNVHNHYIFDKDPLRRGSRWVLHRVTHAATGKRFVCKSIQKTKLCSMEDLAHLQVEIEVHRKLSQCRLSANAEALLLDSCTTITSMELRLHRGLLGDPNIAQLIACYEDSAHAHIVMEECAGCDLFERVKRQKYLGESEAAAALTAVLTVVQHCHAGGVVHRGIQPEGFMYSDESPGAQLKAIDFSTAALVENGLDDEVVGSPHYVAPEMLRGKYGLEVDLWSCGILLYVLLTGYMPFDGSSQLEIFEQVVSAPLNLKTHPWPQISCSAKDLVTRLLTRDPKRRITAPQALKHDWFAEQRALRQAAESAVLEQASSPKAADGVPVQGWVAMGQEGAVHS